MSETTAIRISTVSLVSQFRRVKAAVPLVTAVAVADGARRLLCPRTNAIEPAQVEIRDYFSAAEIERGSRYARPQLALALTRGATNLLAIALLVRWPPALLRRAWRRSAVGGAAVGGVLAVGLTVPTLPLRAVSRRRAIAAGLDTQSWRAWGGDLLKATAIETLFTAASGSAVVAATARYRRYWWAPVAAGSMVVGAGLAALTPVVLDPLFNDFTPLPEGETRADVLELAGAAGVKVGEVYSVDASRRTTAANAYVNGLGPTKRVVLFDTLLDRYSRDEVRMVVAHELAHVRHRDVQRSVLFAGIIALPTALAVQRLSWELSPERGTPGALPALGLAASLVMVPIGLIGNRLSRAVERRADQYSLQLAQVPDAFISFERAIALQNMADLEPPRWVSKLLATHPPTAERIGAAVAFAAAMHPA
jgi:STE24 endopeptidase